MVFNDINFIMITMVFYSTANHDDRICTFSKQITIQCNYGDGIDTVDVAEYNFVSETVECGGTVCLKLLNVSETLEFCVSLVVQCSGI